MNIADILEIVALGPVIWLAVTLVFDLLALVTLGYVAFLVVRAALRWASSATGQQVISAVVVSRATGGSVKTLPTSARRLEGGADYDDLPQYRG